MADFDIPEDWDATQRDIFGELLGGEPEIMADGQLQFLFQEAYFDRSLDPADRALIQDYLEDYLANEYGIDFNAEFDWDAYREWYDSVHS